MPNAKDSVYWKGTIYTCLHPLKPGEAELVDIFPAGFPPDRTLAERYYNMPGKTPAPESVYRAVEVERLILRRLGQEDSYIIIPRTATHMIRKVENA